MTVLITLIIWRVLECR